MTYNWMPMLKNHSVEVITHIVIGLIFSVIYFLVFYWAIKKFNIPTPGREVLEAEIGEEVAVSASGNNIFKEEAVGFLQALGGKDNIESVTNCMTRLRLSIKDVNLVAEDAEFKKYNAKGVVRKGNAIQVIIGFDVENVKNEFEKLL